MSHSFLLMDASRPVRTPGEREALGLPLPSGPLPGGGSILRVAGLSPGLRRAFRQAALLAGGSLESQRSEGRSPLVVMLPHASWAGLLKRLAGGPSALAGLGEELAAARRAAERRSARLRLARRTLPLGRRTLVMGILNVTPDSFYDGGVHQDPSAAVERAFRMVEEGADLIDIGGESTRPGSRGVEAREELRRILPVLRRLAGRVKVPVSVDTTKSRVAAAALDAGAELINDISGLAFEPRLAGVAARAGAGLILGHTRGRPRRMQRRPRYRHLLPEVVDALSRSALRARRSGVGRDAILVDPGIGFGKTLTHNLLLLRHLGALHSTGFPILVGASRKSFVGSILGLDPAERLEGSLAAAALAVAAGAAMLRVHDVAATVRIARVAEAIRDGAPAGRR